LQTNRVTDYHSVQQKRGNKLYVKRDYIAQNVVEIIPVNKM